MHEIKSCHGLNRGNQTFKDQIRHQIHCLFPDLKTQFNSKNGADKKTHTRSSRSILMWRVWRSHPAVVRRPRPGIVHRRLRAVHGSSTPAAGSRRSVHGCSWRTVAWSSCVCRYGSLWWTSDDGDAWSVDGNRLTFGVKFDTGGALCRVLGKMKWRFIATSVLVSAISIFCWKRGKGSKEDYRHNLNNETLIVYFFLIMNMYANPVILRLKPNR